MYTIKHTPPDLLSATQRRDEIATLLATGLARLRSIPLAKSVNRQTEGEFQLANLPNRSVHTNPVNPRQTEAK